MGIPFLSTKDVICLGPIQLDTMMFFYNTRLSEIRGTLLDNLKYIGGHPLTEKIQDVCLGSLYEVLEQSHSLDLLEDIDVSRLSALCHNYRVLSDAIKHYNDTHVLLDNVLTRRKLLGHQPSIN